MDSKLLQLDDKFFLPIDQETVRTSGIDLDTPLRLHVEGNRIVFTPLDPERDRRFREALEETNREYGDVLKRLADS